MDKIQIRTAALEEKDNIKQQLAESIVYRLSGRVASLEYSYAIYRDNLKAFRSWADEHSPQQMLPVNSVQNRKNNESYFLTYLRYLQNALTAMLLFRDHTNKVKSEIEKIKPEFGLIYDQHSAKIFTGSPIPLFLKEFRSYLIHDSLFGCTVTSSYENIRVVGDRVQGIESKVIINVNDLRRSSKWSKSSRELLDAIESGITIQQIFEDYNILLKQFYHRFNESFQSIFEKELVEVGNLIDRHNELVQTITETLKD